MQGRQWETTCEGLERFGQHDEARCFRRRDLVLGEFPPGGGQPDRVLLVDRARLWEHLADDENDWSELQAIERVRYSGACIPGLLDATPETTDAGRLVGLDGMAEAYGALPRAGALLDQPPALLEALGVVRQTRAMMRLLEMREKELAMRAATGRADHG